MSETRVNRNVTTSNAASTSIKHRTPLQYSLGSPAMMDGAKSNTTTETIDMHVNKLSESRLSDSLRSICSRRDSCIISSIYPQAKSSFPALRSSSIVLLNCRLGSTSLLTSWKALWLRSWLYWRFFRCSTSIGSFTGSHIAPNDSSLFL